MDAQQSQTPSSQELAFMLGKLIDSGVPTLRSLRLMEIDLPEGRPKEAIRSAADDLEQGCDLGQALAKHPDVFTDTLVNWVEAGIQHAEVATALIEYGRPFCLKNPLKALALRWATLMEDGAPALDALFRLRHSSDPKFHDAIRDIIRQVNGGETVADAMRKYPEIFDHIFLALVNLGEETGELGHMLETYAFLPDLTGPRKVS